MRIVFVILSIVLFSALSFKGALSLWENLSVCLFVYCFLDFLDNLGKKVVLLDYTILMGIFTCLIMPVIFYHYYTRENPLARIWIKWMPVDAESYFSFVFPATITMAIGLKVPLGNLKFRKHPEIYMQNIRERLKQIPTVGLILVGIGFVAG